MLKYIFKLVCGVAISTSVLSASTQDKLNYSDIVEFSQTTLFNLREIANRACETHEFEIREESIKKSWMKIFGESLESFKNPGTSNPFSIVDLDVPALVVDQICENLDLKDLLNLRKVNKQWKETADASLSSVVVELSIQKLMGKPPKSLPRFGGLHIFDEDDQREIKKGQRILNKEEEQQKRQSFLTFINAIKMPSLKLLSLHACFVDDHVLQKISTTFANLEILKIDSPSYTDTGLNALETLTQLFYADFSNTPLARFDDRQHFPAITTSGVSSFVEKVQNIRFLGLGRCKKIEDLSVLATRKVIGLNLDFLRLSNSEFILELPNLSYLSCILNTSVLEHAKTRSNSNFSFVGVF